MSNFRVTARALVKAIHTEEEILKLLDKDLYMGWTEDKSGAWVPIVRDNAARSEANVVLPKAAHDKITKILKGVIQDAATQTQDEIDRLRAEVGKGL